MRWWGHTFKMLALGGDDHTRGLVADGSAYCWGSNAQGQLGDGTDVPRPTPTKVEKPCPERTA